MQVVKTKNNLIYSAHRTAPSHACLGTCQKVWWIEDIGDRIAAAAILGCPQCGGTLSSSIPNGHYSVISADAKGFDKPGQKVANLSLNLGG